MKKIESSANRHLKQVRKERRARGRGNGVSKALEDQEEEIKHSFQECMEYADEKVGLAMQTYEMVREHCPPLDISPLFSTFDLFTFNVFTAALRGPTLHSASLL